MVVLWQLFLAAILITVRLFGGKYYTGVVMFFVLLWTFKMTHGDLRMNQILIQMVFGGILLTISDDQISKLLDKSDKKEDGDAILGGVSCLVQILLVIGFFLVVYALRYVN